MTNESEFTKPDQGAPSDSTTTLNSSDLNRALGQIQHEPESENGNIFKKLEQAVADEVNSEGQGEVLARFVSPAWGAARKVYGEEEVISKLSEIKKLADKITDKKMEQFKKEGKEQGKDMVFAIVVRTEILPKLDDEFRNELTKAADAEASRQGERQISLGKTKKGEFNMAIRPAESRMLADLLRLIPPGEELEFNVGVPMEGKASIETKEDETKSPEPPPSVEDLARQLYEKELERRQKELDSLPSPEPDYDIWSPANRRHDEFKKAGPAAFLKQAAEDIDNGNAMSASEIQETFKNGGVQVDVPETASGEEESMPQVVEVINQEPEKRPIKPGDLREGAAYYEMTRYEDPNTGEIGYYLFYYSPKGRTLTREQVDETGFEVVNPDNVQKMEVSGKVDAVRQINNILHDVSRREEFKNYIFERNIPVFDERITPGELVRELISEDLVPNKEIEEKVTTNEVYNSLDHVRTNLHTAIDDYERAVKRIGKEETSKSVWTFRTEKEKKEKYRKLRYTVLLDEPIIRNANEYIESKISDLSVDKNDPDYQEFKKLGNKVFEVYSLGVSKEEGSVDAIKHMQKYADTIAERFAVFRKLEERYSQKIAQKEKHPQVPVETTPNVKKTEMLRRVGSFITKEGDIPVARTVAPQQTPIVQLASVAPTTQTLERRAENSQGGSERPRNSLIEQFLEEDNPENTRIVKESNKYIGRDGKERDGVKYSFYRFQPLRDGGIRVLYFTLVNQGNERRGIKPQYINHSYFEIPSTGNFEEEFKAHLEELKGRLHWDSYEIVDQLTNELKDKLQKAEKRPVKARE